MVGLKVDGQAIADNAAAIAGVDMLLGWKEQTGHPSQKPVKVIEPLLMMATKEGDLVLDPMSGSGTTGQAARNLGRYAILCDHSEEYTQIAEKRLDVRRLSLPKAFRTVLEKDESLTPPTWPTFRKPASYGLGPESGQSAGMRQMAFLETYGDGAGTRVALGNPSGEARVPRREHDATSQRVPLYLRHGVRHVPVAAVWRSAGGRACEFLRRHAARKKVRTNTGRDARATKNPRRG